MSKKIEATHLTLAQKQVAYDYANKNVSACILARNNKLSESEIRTILHNAFLDPTVTDSVLKGIQCRAIRNSDTIVTRNFYSNLLKHRQELLNRSNTPSISSKEQLLKKLEIVDFHIQSIDDYGIPDEDSYNLSSLYKEKEELENLIRHAT